MGFDIVIHSPAAILIIAGVLFLAFNDNATGWILVAVGALLVLLVAYITSRQVETKPKA
jgi:protein-S-isoprenylcysteine O-methyltransferase Ste14